MNENLIALYCVIIMSVGLLLSFNSDIDDTPKNPVFILYAKGCGYGVREIKIIKNDNEPKPFLTYKCGYDKNNKLVKVETYNHNKGFGKIPTETTTFIWRGSKLQKIVMRSAYHGSGKVDKEVISFR
jgi:hypothetical protein